jgi:hypothetical protein
MNKILLLLFLETVNSFSQKIGKLEFSITEIDSLSKLESCLVYSDLGSGINAEINDKSGKLITTGSGYEGIDPHFYFTDSLHYKTLNLKGKRFYDNRKTCKLIRADCKSKVVFDNGTFDEVNAKFYYNKNELFFVKYQSQQIVGKKDENVFVENFFYVDVEKKLLKNDNLKKWIISKNEEIIKHCITDR